MKISNLMRSDAMVLALIKLKEWKFALSPIRVLLPHWTFLSE
jgi:hypothetical protein